MSKNKVLDTALSIIDKYIQLDQMEISRKIYAETGFCDQDYNKFLSVISSGSFTLGDYIRKRRIYFAACELVSHQDKPITDIALDYGYSDQSAFSRAVKKEYGNTPAEIRKNKMTFQNNRLNLEDYMTSNTRLDAILKKCDSSSELCYSDRECFNSFIQATEEYGFDVSTCCLISELAERLEIPFSRLIDICIDIALDYKYDPNCIPPWVDYFLDLGIHSDIELKEICNYYECDRYELTPKMVREYQENHK